MLAVRVKKKEAESVRKKLIQEGILDKDRKIQKIDNHIEIPVTCKFGNYSYLNQNKPIHYHPRLSFKTLINSLRKELDQEDINNLSKGWELIGDVLILKIDNNIRVEKRQLIAKKFLEFMPKVKTVLNREGILDLFRKPLTELLIGTIHDTIHSENGCKFKIDPSKVMFCSGNIQERQRMATISNQNEVVLDMFSGIGQFSVPLAKYSNPKKVLAIEKNPMAYKYLVENVKLNDLTNVKPILGDCTIKSPKKYANRVIMGYLFKTIKFLPFALTALKDGGIIHCHSIVHKSDFNTEKAKIKKFIEKSGYDLNKIDYRSIKSYSPFYYHIVYDIDISS